MNIFARTLLIVYLFVILILSILPSNDENSLSSIYLTDTGAILHFFAYLVGSGLGYLAFRKAIAVSCFVVLYSILLELIQLYIPSRTFNIFDIFANIAGVLFFSFLFVIRRIFISFYSNRAS